MCISFVRVFFIEKVILLRRKGNFRPPSVDFTRKIAKMQIFEKIMKIQRVSKGSKLVGVVGVVGVSLLGRPKCRFSPLPTYLISTLVFCSYSSFAGGKTLVRNEEIYLLRRVLLIPIQNFKKYFTTPISRNSNSNISCFAE